MMPSSSSPSVMTQAGQILKNGARLILSPLTQTLMAVGIFPAQMLSTVKKIPGLKSMVGFITRKVGNDSRRAAQTYEDDFLNKTAQSAKTGFFGQIYNWFNRNPKAAPFNTDGVVVNPISRTPYTTDFGRSVSLETFSFEPVGFKQLPKAQQYYRLHCSGNSGNCSRFFGELALLSQNHPDLKTITYNHPGVEGSDGVTMTQDDLINALYTQVKSLLDSGVSTENIELTGFSIGAATAALTAQKLKAEGYEVNLFCDRTLSTLPDVVTDKLPLIGVAFKLLKLIPGIKELTHYVIQPAIKYLVATPLLWLINWNMDPASAYKDIDRHKKALTGVKPQSMGDDGILKRIGKYFGSFTGVFKHGNGDKTIAPHVSLLVGTEDVAAKAQWKNELKLLSQATNATLVERDILLSHLEEHAENAITSNALMRLRLNNPEEAHASNEQLMNLVQAGDKGRRLQGVVESDAHNVTADKIRQREVKAGIKGALAASELPADSTPNLLTYYSMFHQAVKSNNQLLAATVMEPAVVLL